MRPWFVAVFAVAFFVAPSWAQEGTEKKSDERAEQLKQLKTDFLKARSQAFLKFRNAKTEEEKAEALRSQPKINDYVPAMIKIASADPKDAVAFEALTMAFSLTRGSAPVVLNLLAEHHAKNPAIKLICRQLVTLPPPQVGKLLHAVLAENPDNETRAYACFALGSLAAAKADTGDDAAAAEAEKYLNRVCTEFGDLKMGRTTMAEAAKNALHEVTHLRVGKTAPLAESEALEGAKSKLADFKGKVVVLDFWATWCGPCRAMIPHEREMVERLKDRPFSLISISADEKRDVLEKFLEKEPMPWVHWWEGAQGRMLKEWNIRFFPTLYVLDARGVIRYKNIRGQQLEDAVTKLLEETK